MEQTGIKNGIIYCRVSSKEQVEGTSLEMQERICREYAKRNDVEIPNGNVFVDRGESAKTTDRPEFIKAITLCSNKKHKVDYFIVYKLDRFARNQDDHVTTRALLRRYGTELRSATEPINESSVGRAMEGMISVFAEFDNNVRTERTKGGMQERIKQGFWVWQAPLGYYRIRQGSNITPEPNTASYIRLMFEEYTKGIYSYKSLSEFLSNRGFRTRTGKEPCAQLIEKMIKNPIYCGNIVVWGMRIKGDFEPIIDENLFNRCQEKYKGKSRFTKRASSNYDFPLKKTGCSVCQTSITGSYSKGRNGTKYPYYHHQKQGCINDKFIPKETFEQLFCEYLDDITPSIRYENAFKAVVIDIWKSNYKKFDEQNGQIRKELDRLEQERQKVFELHRTGTYSDNEFNEQKNLVNQKIYERRQLMDENHIEEFDMEEALNYCFQFVRNTVNTWRRLGYDSKLRFQNNIFPEKISFDGKKFGTAKLSRIYALNQEYNGKKSHLVTPSGFEPEFQE